MNVHLDTEINSYLKRVKRDIRRSCEFKLHLHSQWALVIKCETGRVEGHFLVSVSILLLFWHIIDSNVWGGLRSIKPGDCLEKYFGSPSESMWLCSSHHEPE